MTAMATALLGAGTVPVTGKNDRPAQENCNA